MTSGRPAERARIRVALDPRHPLAYLALHPTIAFADSMKHSVDVDWVPIDVPALNPPSPPAEGDDRGVRHRRLRAQSIAREIEVYGAAQGLTLREPYRSGSSEAARRAWLWLRDRHPDRLVAFLVAMFRDYWSVRLDVSDSAAIADRIAASGGDAPGFMLWQDDEGRLASETIARELAASGIFQTPAYLLDGEVFYGRQHLSMLRWIVEGRVGAGPI